MQNYIKQTNDKLKEKGLPVWELHIGIHPGPVVAGIVGRKKYAYDIWGTTENITSRMESNGEAGLINISATTFEMIKAHYNCLYRGKFMQKISGRSICVWLKKKYSEI